MESMESVWPQNLTALSPSIQSDYLVECIGDAFLLLNENGVIVFANSSAERILQQPRQQLIGQQLASLISELGEQTFSKALRQNSQEGPPKPLMVPVRLHGELHQLEFGIHPHRDGTGVLFRDISERVKQDLEITKLTATMVASQELLRRKNDELNESLEKLGRMNDELAQADRLKSEFLANTSHELRTPLNSIIGFLQLIHEGLCESRDEELVYIQNALTSGQHLLSLINDVLDITKIEAGKMTLLIDDVNIDNAFQEVLSLTHVQSQQKGLTLNYEMRGEEQIHARADFHKLKQVLINLVGNSIKFTNKGFIRVWAEPDPLQSDMVRINIQDSGIGVPLNRQQVIFEKFTQVDGTSTRKYQGTGLGLAITKNLVELMGGTIQIQSAGEDQGTTIWFTLPMGSSPMAQRETDNSDPQDEGNTLPETF